MTKTLAMVLGLGVIFLFGTASFVFPGERSSQLPAILTAVVTLTGGYFVNQTINNGVKGKNWNRDMHDTENPEAAKRRDEILKYRDDKQGDPDEVQ